MNDNALQLAALRVIEGTSGIMLPLEALSDDADIRVNAGAMKSLKAALIGPAGLPSGVSFHEFSNRLARKPPEEPDFESLCREFPAPEPIE